MLFFCLSGVILTLLQLLELKWRWLEIINITLFAISVLLLAISWLTPGILIILGTPWLAYAWFRGMNTAIVQDKPWEQLSGFQKISIYFWAIFISGFTLLAIIAFILLAIRG
jgi:hypothetical protein